MSDIAINTTASENPDPSRRLELVRLARQHISNGGTAAEFAKEHDLPRTTVIGWCKGHDGPRGRPSKLPAYNETEILNLLSADQKLHNWRTIQELIRTRSGERMGRRSIFRLLKKWELSLDSTLPNEIRAITATEWVQPKGTVYRTDAALSRTLWRLISKRGMECFMFTSGASSAVAEQVGAAMLEKVRGRNRQLQTNHPDLAQVLRDKLPDWEVVVF